MRGWAIALLLIGCTKQDPHQLPSVLADLSQAYERTAKLPTPLATLYHPDGVVLASTGLFVNKAKVADYAELTPSLVSKLLAAAPDHPLPPADPYSVKLAASHSIVIYPDVPTRSVDLVLRGVSRLGWKHVWVGVLRDHDIELVCAANFIPKLPPAAGDDERVVLAIDVEPDKIWVALSRVNEFQEIPQTATGLDYEKLRTTIREHKASAFFADREDIEIGFPPTTPLPVYLGVLNVVGEHFHDIQILDREELAAKPTL